MRIKCLLAVLACISFVCHPVNAQDEEETRHEVAISYGAVPNSIWVDVFTDVIKAYFGETQDGYKYVGPIALEYFYHTSPLIGVGAVAVFATNNEDSYEEEVKVKYFSRSYFTFMPSVKFNWLRKHHWGLYSKLAVGATYADLSCEDYDANGKKNGDKITEKDLLFNYQASLIGVEAGGDHMRGFAEFGIGEQGIALAGLRFKF